MSLRIDGVYVANVSFFAADGSLDQGAMEDHLEFLASHGVQGFVPCGTTGESPTLDEREWGACIALAKKIADQNGLKVIAGCSGNSTEKVETLIQKAHGLGADAALVICPYYNKPTQAGLLAHFNYLADKTLIPLVLYNIPGRTNVNLSVSTLAALFQHENIIGVKDSTGDYNTWINIASQIYLRTRSLISGDDGAYASILALGGSGIISASANVIPEHFVQIHRTAQSGDLKAAHEIQKRIQPLVNALFLETNPSPVKYALAQRLGTSPAVRLPLVETSSGTQKAIREALKTLEIHS